MTTRRSPRGAAQCHRECPRTRGGASRPRTPRGAVPGYSRKSCQPGSEGAEVRRPEAFFQSPYGSLTHACPSDTLAPGPAAEAVELRPMAARAARIRVSRSPGTELRHFPDRGRRPITLTVPTLHHPPSAVRISVMLARRRDTTDRRSLNHRRAPTDTASEAACTRQMALVTPSVTCRSSSASAAELARSWLSVAWTLSSAMRA